MRPTDESYNASMLSLQSLKALASAAGAADGQLKWPAESWEVLRQERVLGWCVPASHGGEGRSHLELLAGYESLASACLTICFILSQRDAACRRIRDSGNEL